MKLYTTDTSTNRYITMYGGSNPPYYCGYAYRLLTIDLQNTGYRNTATVKILNDRDRIQRSKELKEMYGRK